MIRPAHAALSLATTCFLVIGGTGCSQYVATFRGRVLSEMRVRETHTFGPIALAAAELDSDVGSLTVWLSRCVTSRFDVVREYEKVGVVGQFDDGAKDKRGWLPKPEAGDSSIATHLKTRVFVGTTILAGPVILPFVIRDAIENDKQAKRAIAAIRDGALEAEAAYRLWDGTEYTMVYRRVIYGRETETIRGQSEQQVVPVADVVVRVRLGDAAHGPRDARTDEHGVARVVLVHTFREALELRPVDLRISVECNGSWAEIGTLRLDERHIAAIVEGAKLKAE